MAIHVGMATAAIMTQLMKRATEPATPRELNDRMRIIVMTPDTKFMGMTTSAGSSIFSDFLTAP